MSVLEYLEVKIIENCNYRCSGCAGWGNIAQREVYDIEQYECDIKRISELFSHVKMLHILGGEPLLNERVTDYITIAREYLKDTEIYLITNGTLLHTTDDDFFQCVKENDVKVHISHYPVEKDMNKIDIACTMLKERNMRFEIIDTNLFSVSMLLENNRFDVNDTFKTCSSFMDCTNLYYGMIYKCPRPISLRHYDRKFGTCYSDMTDGIDIYDSAITGQEILQKLENPIKTCRLCTPERKFLKWSQKEADIFQWQICKENSLLIDAEKNQNELFDFVKDFKLTLFNIDHATGKICREEYMSEEIDELIKEDVYIWLNDLRCLSYCYILKYVVEIKKGSIRGVISKNKRIADSLWGFPKLEKKNIEDISHLVVLASGVKGFIEAEYEICKLLSGE